MTVKARVKSAARSLGAVLAIEPKAPEETDVLDTLKGEHNAVKALLQELEEANGKTQRRQLVERIAAALVPHSKAEEKVVYDAILALRDKPAQVDGHEGYLEHELAAKTLQQLEKITDADSAEHRAAGKVLKELLTHHIKEEEANVWKDVKANFSDDDRRQMNVRFLAAKARVTVH